MSDDKGQCFVSTSRFNPPPIKAGGLYALGDFDDAFMRAMREMAGKIALSARYGEASDEPPATVDGWGKDVMPRSAVLHIDPIRVRVYPCTDTTDEVEVMTRLRSVEVVR